MSNSTEAVDNLFKVTMDGVEFVFRLVKQGADLAVKTQELAARKEQLSIMRGDFSTLNVIGEVSQEELFRATGGKGVASFTVRQNDLDDLVEGMRKAGITYTVSEPDEAISGQFVYYIWIPSFQAAMMNNIIAAKGVNTLDRENYASADIEKKVESVPTNREKNEAFLQRAMSSYQAEQNGMPLEDKDLDINPPTAARNPISDRPSEAASQNTENRPDTVQEGDAAIHRGSDIGLEGRESTKERLLRIQQQARDEQTATELSTQSPNQTVSTPISNDITN